MMRSLNRNQEMTMVLQQHTDQIDISHNIYALAQAGLEKTGRSGQDCHVLSVGADLDPGIRRKHRPNEDTILVTHGFFPSHATAPQPFVLLAVADGVGGVGHGQEASQLATSSLVEYVFHSLNLPQEPHKDWLSLLKAGVQYANRFVYEHSLQEHTTMATTMTAVMVSGTTAYVAHVGDSRLYLYRELAGLVQKTRDHSVVAMLVEEGIIGPGDIYTHPKRNQIYRSLGYEVTVEVDVSPIPLAAGDILLLCSDGLWEMVRDQQIASIMTISMPTLSHTAHALIQAALAGGGADNISAIVAQVRSV
jgi:serine/threonine protein phosphatase PrpC